MKTYICYYNCPFCKNPCVDDPEKEGNEMLYADSKAEARKYFNNCKQCRNMKITRIVEDKPDGVTEVSVTINGVETPCASLGEALNILCAAQFKELAERGA